MGARQVGKTTLVRQLGRSHYESVAEINFFDNKVAVETAIAATSADDLFLRLSVLARTEFIPGKTLIFLDEIQECQRVNGTIDALTWLKFLVERTGCDYIFPVRCLGSTRSARLRCPRDRFRLASARWRGHLCTQSWGARVPACPQERTVRR